MTPAELGDPAAGYFFTPPGGWQVEDQEGRFVLAEPSDELVVMVIPHAASKRQELQPLFEEGWVEPGAALAPEGEPVQQDDQVTQRLAGEVQGQAARGMLVVRFSPEGGGVIVIGITPGNASEAGVSRAVGEIVESLRFTTPDTADLMTSWDALLRGKKLTYLHSYRSSGPPVEGAMTGGGMTERHELALHADGSFEEAGESSLDIDVGGAGADRSEQVASTGTWSLVPAAGQALLELRRDDGTDSYVLSRSDGEVWLNDRRYFVTDS
jgi:hypothetical protein